MKLFLITNRHLVKEGNYIDVIKEAVKGGVDTVILREKDLSTDQLLQYANEIKSSIKGYRTSFIINSDLKAAKIIKSDGLHLSYLDFMNKSYEWDGIIGVSIHSVYEGIEAEKSGADYLLASHIFPTDCKKDLPPKGVQFIEELKTKVSIPVIALGGINERNALSLKNIGTDGIAVMSYIMGARSPYDAAKNLKLK